MNKNNLTFIKNREEIHKILIIKWGAMGDCVIMSALLDEIRDAFPKAVIDLNVLPPWHHLFQYEIESGIKIDHRIDHLISFPMRKSGIKPFFKWLMHLKKERYDLILDFQTNDKTKMLLSIAKLLGWAGKYRLGNHKWGSLYHFYPDHADQIHAYQRHIQALNKLGISIKAKKPKLILNPILKNRVLNQSIELGLVSLVDSPFNTIKQKELAHFFNLETPIKKIKPFAIFFPGCSPKAMHKRWPSQYYAELGNILKRKGLANILLIGAKDEANICQEITNSDPSFYINLCEKTQLLEIPIWCQLSYFCVGNDTGASHLAAIANQPIFVFFGPTNETLSKPIGDHVYPITNPDTSCRPCAKIGCEPHSCLQSLTPEIVFKTHFEPMIPTLFAD